MNKKASLGIFTILTLIHVILGTFIGVIYYDHIKARSCNSDLECGENSFCDEKNRCQFKESILRDSQEVVTIHKNNFKWGIIFIVISIIVALLILRGRYKYWP